MTVQIAIIGLGQIGTSIGLALSDQKESIRRIGHDRVLSVARQAEKMGAVDRVEISLPKAVREADLALLALPVDEIKETLSIIAPELKENVVVMDTGAIKKVVADWALESLPEGRFYVGLTPVINPAYLHEAESGIDAAHKDLFKGGLMAIVAPPSASAQAVKLAEDLTRLIGSRPLFVDPDEIDGLMAATHWLPQIMAAALLQATVDQPGWQEGRKVAGRPYAEATGPIVHLGEARTLSKIALYSRQNLTRVIDNVMAALKVIRDDIYQQDVQALESFLKQAYDGRQNWWAERQGGEWLSDDMGLPQMPEKPGILEHLLGLHKKPQRD